MQPWQEIRLIVDKLEGKAQDDTDAKELEEAWQRVHARVRPAASREEARFLVWQATEGMPDQEVMRARLMDALAGADAIGGTRAVSLAELAPRLLRIAWLWPGWLPRGLLSLLGAAPGAGKSLVALDLARRVIGGEAFPDGAAVTYRDEGAPPGGLRHTVLYVDAEAIPQVLHVRAAAWDVDLRRLFTVLPAGPHDVLDLSDAVQQDRVVRAVSEVRPELVIVDSLSSITRKGENNVEEVRAILSFLAHLAMEMDVAVLLIHHLRKRGRAAGGRQRGASDVVTAQEFRGSGHITSMARSVLALSVIQTGPEPERNSPRRLEVVKSNLGCYPEALGVRFVADERGAPVLRYGEAPVVYSPATLVDECAEWLMGVLEEARRPMRPKDVLALAEAKGFKQGVVYRARKRLEGVVVDTERGRSPTNRWRIAS